MFHVMFVKIRVLKYGGLTVCEAMLVGFLSWVLVALVTDGQEELFLHWNFVYRV